MKDTFLRMLREEDWGPDTELMSALRGWNRYPLLEQTYRSLKEHALFPSHVHGVGHICRALLLAALVAQGEGIDEPMTILYFNAACYHDVGRTFDGYDPDHGARSSLRLAELTGISGRDLLRLKAAVTAHARPDDQAENILRQFCPDDMEAAMQLTRLLKDADNLDRVRLGDLNPAFLRTDTAKGLTEFAKNLFRRSRENGF